VYKAAMCTPTTRSRADRNAAETRPLINAFPTSQHVWGP
jgi:hypothetical protein